MRTSARLRRTAQFIILEAVLVAGVAAAEPLKVVSFNLESGEASIDTLAEQVKELSPVDIWGFSEVQDRGWAKALAKAAEDATGAPYWYILGTTGGEDRLVILYREDRLDRIRSFQLSSINIGGGVRAPLVTEFEDRETGQRFLFMVNHLYRGREDRRHEQARLLNAWARAQSLPIVAVGDYNFDWEVVGGDAEHDEGYDLLTDDEVLVWVRPATLLKTQCDPGFTSVLDFVFAGGEAKGWDAESEILFTDDDYCLDDNFKSDHRPLAAAFDLPHE